MKVNFDMTKIAGGLAEGVLQALGTGALGMLGGFLTKMAISAVKSRNNPALPESTTPDGLEDAITVESTEPAIEATVKPETPETVEVTFDETAE